MTTTSSGSTRGFRDVRYNELYETNNDCEDQFNLFGDRPHLPVAGVVENLGSKGEFTVYDHVAPFSASSTASEYPGGKDYFSMERTQTPTPQATAYYRPPSVGRPRSIASSNAGFERPMTAVRAAGYSSRGSRFDPLNQASSLLGQKDELSPEYQIREMERQVNQILEESAKESLLGQYSSALDKAKEAGKKERLLCKHREQAGMADQMNTELTFAVCFNLAYQYQMNRLHSEALNTYSQIVKNKQFSQGRLRMNMGNIYYGQQKYSLAIKMYRMALDQTPSSYKDTRYKIMRSIGNALMKIGQYQDAVQSYEGVMEMKMDHHTAYNLIVCYYVLGNEVKMKSCFTKMLLVRHYDGDDGDDEIEDLRKDGFRKELLVKQENANRYILTSARLIAPVIGSSLVEGYNWVIDLLGDQQYVALAHEMEMDKAIQHLHRRDFLQAIALLKEFEKKDKDLQARAATNLSFLYFLEGDLCNAEKHAELAVRTDRFNACALVNQANCLFQRGDVEGAKALYIEASQVDTDCIEAVYNLGLAYKKLGAFEDSLNTFKKITCVLPNSTEVLFQIGNVNEMMGNTKQAIKWLELVATKVMHDACLLAMLGNLYVRCDGEQAKALHYYSESHRLYPTNIHITSWLASYYLKSELYEKAMPYFHLASTVQPSEVKWQLMTALCYRRTGALSKALRKYRGIVREYPENVECLRCLVHLCTSLGEKEEVEEYQSRLRKLDNYNKNIINSSYLDLLQSRKVKNEDEWELSDDLLPM